MLVRAGLDGIGAPVLTAAPNAHEAAAAEFAVTASSVDVEAVRAAYLVE